MKKILSMVFVLMLVSSLWSTQASAASYDRAKTAKTVKVYVKAGTSYKVAYTVPKGKAVKVIGGVDVGWDQDRWYSPDQFGFYKITYKNKKGYVAQGNLNFTSAYSWVPGVKAKAKKYAKSYADNNPYRFVKSKKYGKDGYYSIQHKWNGTWYTIGRVNCKTGAIHG